LTVKQHNLLRNFITLVAIFVVSQSFASYQVRSASTWQQLNDWSRYAIYVGAQTNGVPYAYMILGNLGTGEANRLHLRSHNGPDGLILFPSPNYPSALRGECVAFVRSVTDAPVTSRWRPGKRVMSGSVKPGTVIATFDARGQFTGHTCVFRTYGGGGRDFDCWSQNWPTGFGLIHHTMRGLPGTLGDPDRYFVVEAN
jgi:hypothetical protein